VEVPRIEYSRFHRVWEIDSDELSPSSWQTLSNSAFFVSDVFLENRKANASIILPHYATTLENNNATVRQSWECLECAPPPRKPREELTFLNLNPSLVTMSGAVLLIPKANPRFFSFSSQSILDLTAR
jgi:hypothetical protein